jgi:hypothetical protein
LELLPAVFDPQRATEPGAPQLHGEKGAESRIADPASNLVAELRQRPHALLLGGRVEQVAGPIA